MHPQPRDASNCSWKSVTDVELAAAEYIDWYNRRLHGELDHAPPAEYETTYGANSQTQHYPDNPVLTEARTR